MYVLRAYGRKLLTGFTCVNKKEMMCEKACITIKVEPRSAFTFMSDLPYIISILFTHVKPVKVYVHLKSQCGIMAVCKG